MSGHSRSSRIHSTTRFQGSRSSPESNRFQNFSHCLKSSACVVFFHRRRIRACVWKLRLRLIRKPEIIADAFLIVGHGGGLAKPLVTEAEGQRFSFSIGDDDLTSKRCHVQAILAVVLNFDKTGRLIKYDRSCKKEPKTCLLSFRVNLSESREVVEVLRDKKGKRLRFISEVEEKDGKLWIGLVLMPFLAFFVFMICCFLHY
ncbi:unnamed protein product [Thlaspi arvense]|uniref:Uncharacterized protein n=1 Tax=Thlaspi arvense TaxID=13288 RepID=A0AAU9T8W6_THLAR|nr:unnamed protein product [Thlaspi arvense]